MSRRAVFALFAAVVGLSLVASPVLMSDWDEQAVLIADPIEQSQLDDEVPVLQYDDLSPDAQTAVRKAITPPDGSHIVYGREDWPDEFFYSDYASPGSGQYAVVYQDQYYELMTYAGGSFPFVFWSYELPLIGYGFVLLWLTKRTYLGRYPIRNIVPLAALGVIFHLLGPEFDFPVLEPMQLVGLWTVAAVGIVLVAAREYFYAGSPTEA
ncbi:hypothetical protein ACFQJC_03550 [Haloferax namakaokahaiae]|uniref:DUF7979 domain-containing protein n=1 Tax=Haloferax namakaokahaiae TaxID=1748331 RepID=A0ABD5ZBE5_9EURY